MDYWAKRFCLPDFDCHYSFIKGTEPSPVWKRVNLFMVLYWCELSTDQKKKTDVSVNLTAMLRIPNYAIISHTKDSQQHRNWPLFHSVPADAVWIKQQHVCSHTALTVWRHCSSVLLSVSVVFVNWCFLFVFCEYMIISFVSFGAKKRTAVLKESLGKLRARVTL